MFALALIGCAEYVPTVVVHGITDDTGDMAYIAQAIQETYPGMLVVNNEIGNGKIDSIFMELGDQVAELARNIQNDPRLASGFNFLCHSQGSILCRAYIALHNTPPVRRLITTAGPNAGFFCGRKTECPWVGTLPLVEMLVDELIYTEFVQNMLSVSGYWRTPYDNEMYLEECRVLPIIDNEREFNQTVKDHYLGLQRVVLVGSPLDDLIRPWDSSFFAFYPEGQDESTVALEERDTYKQDWIGLRTIAERGDLLRIVAEGFDHHMYKFAENQPWMRENVYVHLNDTFQ